jgi:hypothetical protein
MSRENERRRARQRPKRKDVTVIKKKSKVQKVKAIEGKDEHIKKLSLVVSLSTHIKTPTIRTSNIAPHP